MWSKQHATKELKWLKGCKYAACRMTEKGGQTTANTGHE